jgi:hypothetical protein
MQDYRLASANDRLRTYCVKCLVQFGLELFQLLCLRSVRAFAAGLLPQLAQLPALAIVASFVGDAVSQPCTATTTRLIWTAFGCSRVSTCEILFHHSFRSVAYCFSSSALIPSVLSRKYSGIPDNFTASLLSKQAQVMSRLFAVG